MEKKDPFTKKLWRPEVDVGIMGLVLLKTYIVKNLSPIMFEKAHKYVFNFSWSTHI